MSAAYVALDGYEVRVVTAKAAGIAKTGEPADIELIWIPFSQCAEVYEKGETDIEVAKWLADKEGLDY